jgi:hypothetical protein
MIWQCTHNTFPQLWELGKQVGDHMENVVATVSRLRSGGWHWELIFNCGGNEPSREEAMAAAEKEYKERTREAE